jgi:hypothetical protein
MVMDHASATLYLSDEVASKAAQRRITVRGDIFQQSVNDSMGMQPVQTTRRLNPAALFEEIIRTAFTRLWLGFFFLLNLQTAGIKDLIWSWQ